MTQNLELLFGALDTGVDPALAGPGVLTLAENATCQTTDLYEKRHGYTALAVNLASIMRLAVLGTQLLACDGTILANYDPAGVPSNNGWHGVGTAIPTAVSQKSINLDQSTDIDRSTTATTNGVRADSWIDSSSSVTVQLSNEATGGFISRTIVDSTGVWDFVHSVVVGNYIYVVYASASMQKINAVLVNTTDETVSGTTALQSGANVSAAVAVMDIVAVSATDVILAWSSNTPNIRVHRFNAISGASVAGPTAISGETADVGLAVMATEGEFGNILYHSTVSGGMRSACFNVATVAQTVAPFMVEADPVAVPPNLNCGLVRQDATHVRAFWDWGFVSSTTNPYSKWTEISSAGAVGTLRALNNSRLASKPYAYGGNFYINLARQGQDGLFTTNVTVQTLLAAAPPARPIALHGYRGIHGSLPPGQLPDISSPASGVYRYNSQLAYKFLASATPRRAVACFTTSFVDPKRMLPLEANGDVLFAGGSPLKYDGVSLTENNFIYAPEIISIVPGAVGAGGMDNGTRSYIITFESSDARGNTARSTMSVPRSATTTAGAGLGKVTLIITQLNMTRLGWVSNAQQGIIAVWRTGNGGSTYNLVTTIKIDPTAATTTYVDQAQDGAIGGNRQLYTNGGVLEREPPLPARHMVLHQGRVWGISSADPKVIFYSGDVTPGEDVWFAAGNGAQFFRVEPGGEDVALASLDDKLIVFKGDRIFKVYGRGQNQLGANNDLVLPQLISSDCGCIEPRSVIQTPDGVMFLSEKGIQLLTRSEQVVYIGGPVFRWTQEYATCTSAVMLTDRREIRFAMTDPVAPVVTPTCVDLVYNYDEKRWTHHLKYADKPSVDAVNVPGSGYTWAASGGDVYQENTTFLDPGSTYISMTLETAWVKPAGLQGFVRVPRVLFLGSFRSEHDLEVQIAKDYSDIYTMDFTYPWATLQSFVGEQVVVQPFDQKGEAYRFRFSDNDPNTAGRGEAYAAVGLLLKTLLKRGAFDKAMSAGSRL